LEGGSDTSSYYLQSLVLALVSHLDVQRKAHAELDRIVGRDRSPAMEDLASLPYIQAIVKEVLYSTSLAAMTAVLTGTLRFIAGDRLPHCASPMERWQMNTCAPPSQNSYACLTHQSVVQRLSYSQGTRHRHDSGCYRLAIANDLSCRTPRSSSITVSSASTCTSTLLLMETFAV
jgi:hypothetical protein